MTADQYSRRLRLLRCPPVPETEDLHEWISFNDTDGDTWMFDVSFLTSPWTCIFGAGCQGVLTGPAAHLEQGCCSYGAHLVDAEDQARTEAIASRLTPAQWQHHAHAAEFGQVTERREGELVTRLVDDACIFLNRPGFPGGAGCALHVGALAAGERYIDWKPAVCWQLPLRLDEHTDSSGHRTYTLREWKRRDWGDGGAEFHWWCTDDDDAFRGRSPVYQTLRDEIVEMIGPGIYDRLVEKLRDRPRVRFLPHPAVRRHRAAGAASE